MMILSWSIMTLTHLSRHLWLFDAQDIDHRCHGN
jgi:hypothetical protein